jgi:hypothetical protein
LSCNTKDGTLLLVISNKNKETDMPPTDIVRDVRVLFQNKLAASVPARWHRQFLFGVQAYSLRPFQSANGNARSVVGNPHTASTKCDRLLGNGKLAAHLGVVFDQLGLVQRSSYVNVDHSDLHGLTSLVAAVQTRKGRAIPCLVETTFAHHIPSSGSSYATARTGRLRADMVVARKSQSFTGHTIDALQNLHDRLGFWPKGLVFDRGFGNESLVTHLQAEGATFYVRLKAGRYVECDGQKTTIQQLPVRDTTIQLFGLQLRVVRSPKSRRAPEPWYILTNDLGSSRDTVVRIYYHRFEIEETFRDMKQLFESHRARLLKPTSLQVLWWLVALGIAVLYVVTKPKRTSKQLGHRVHPKKRRSWVRQAYEQLQLAAGQLMWQHEQTG